MAWARGDGVTRLFQPGLDRAGWLSPAHGRLIVSSHCHRSKRLAVGPTDHQPARRMFRGGGLGMSRAA